MATTLQQVQTPWPPLSEVLHVPYSEKEYQDLVAVLDRLIDKVGEDENHPLSSLMEVLGVLIEKYEDDHVPEITEVLSLESRSDSLSHRDVVPCTRPGTTSRAQ